MRVGRFIGYRGQLVEVSCLFEQERQAVQLLQLAPDLAPLRRRAQVQLAQQHLRQSQSFTVQNHHIAKSTMKIPTPL